MLLNGFIFHLNPGIRMPLSPHVANDDKVGQHCFRPSNGGNYHLAWKHSQIMIIDKWAWEKLYLFRILKGTPQILRRTVTTTQTYPGRWGRWGGSPRRCPTRAWKPSLRPSGPRGSSSPHRQVQQLPSQLNNNTSNLETKEVLDRQDIRTGLLLNFNQNQEKDLQR